MGRRNVGVRLRGSVGDLLPERGLVLGRHGWNRADNWRSWAGEEGLGEGQEDRNGAERARSLRRRGVSVSHTLLDEPDVREAHLLVQ
jgi:hypothetical protein